MKTLVLKTLSVIFFSSLGGLIAPFLGVALWKGIVISLCGWTFLAFLNISMAFLNTAVKALTDKLNDARKTKI